MKLEFNISLGIISPISVICVLFLFGEAKTPNLSIEQIPRMRIGMTGLFYHSAFLFLWAVRTESRSALPTSIGMAVLLNMQTVLPYTI